MKKVLISMLILIAWTTSLLAQITREQADVIVSEPIQNEEKSSYLPIITPDKIWRLEHGWWCPEAEGTCNCYGGLSTRKIGNTKTFNGKVYYELLYYLANQWQVFTYLREENRKVFFYSEKCDVEYLLYDFNLNVGDEVILIDPMELWNCELHEHSFIKYIVSEVDEIEYFQVKRKRLKFAYNGNICYDIWVEGIGGMIGIPYHRVTPITGVRQLKDCYESDELIFVNEDLFYCWVYVAIDDVQQDLIRIFTDENNILHIANAKDTPLIMYDMQGRKIKSIFPENDNYKINVSYLPKGLYIVIDQTKSITSKVIVK